MDNSPTETDGFIWNTFDAGDACHARLPIERCTSSEEDDSQSKVIETYEEEMSDDASPLDKNVNKQLEQKSHLNRKLPRRKTRSKIDIAKDDEEEAFLYGSKHVIMLFVPVTLCMIIVVATITSTTYYTETTVYLVYTPFHEKTEDTATIVWQSTANALIMLSMIIVMTVLLLLLYKFRFYRVINGWLMLTSVMLLFFFAYIYLEQMLRAFNVPIDYITISILMWNFGVGGLFCIHWKGPLLLQQIYLIVISALVALTFIKYMPNWTTWTVLGGLVIWDLAAVLCPKGPLKMLVETAQSRNEPLFPALIYSSTMMWQITMADHEQSGQETKHNPPVTPTVSHPLPAPVSHPLPAPLSGEVPPADAHLHLSGVARQPSISHMPLAGAQTPVSPTDGQVSRNEMKKDPGNTSTFPQLPANLDADVDLSVVNSDISDEQQNEAMLRRLSKLIAEGSPVDPPRAKASAKHTKKDKKAAHPRAIKRASVNTQSDKSDDKEERGIKLGLGDFIFYGVLVGKASVIGDWNTTIACFVAILIGLCFTLLLLAIYRKALPALPISLSFGLVFNFTTIILVKPFMENLASEQVYI